MHIGVVGAGFVGVTTAVALAEQGHAITLVESAAERREAIQANRLPFFEPGVEDALQILQQDGRIRCVADVTEAGAWDAVIICVGTPQDADGRADLRAIEAASKQIADALRDSAHAPLVVVKSTVPPGTTRDLVGGIMAEAGRHVQLAMVPEFLREGHALADARAPDRVVIGTNTPEAASIARAIFSLADAPTMETDTTTAELIKYASNSLLAMRISAINELAILSERLGVNVDDVAHGVGLDDRIGPKFLQAGPGFGGSCFPKDLSAIAAIGQDAGVPMRMVDAALAINQTQPRHVVDQLAAHMDDGLEGRRVAILGVAFKADTSDVRETRALPIHQALLERGASVICHDPMAGDEYRRLMPDAVFAQTIAEVLDGADAAILHTDWADYRRLDPQDLQAMTTPIILDTRRILDPDAMATAGVRLIRLGDGRTKAEATA